MVTLVIVPQWGARVPNIIALIKGDPRDYDPNHPKFTKDHISNSLPHVILVKLYNLKLSEHGCVPKVQSGQMILGSNDNENLQPTTHKKIESC